MRTPKWSKQTYELVASIMRERTAAYVTAEACGTYSGTTEMSEAVLDELQEIVKRFANAFAADNPAFDRNKFLKATEPR